MTLDTKAIDRARTEWFETGSVSEPLARVVRPEILASWRRSKAFGAQSQVNALPYHEDNGATERLFVAAEPVLRNLAESLAGLHAGVLLADREANIVQRWVADRTILKSLDRISSNAGFSAPEHCVGTNGIGTIAELGRAQMVVGLEHYADALVGFACVGAPIHSPTTRRLEGIITLSCRADAANDLLTPLMVSTAADIEHRLLECATFDERLLLEAYLAAKRRFRLVAAVGKDLLIAGARATRVLDQLVDRDVLWDVASDVAASEDLTRRVMPVSDGTEVSVTFTPIRDFDRLIGAIIDLDDATDGPVVRRKRPAGGKTPPICLPGNNVKWQSVVDSAVRYARDRIPAAVFGQPGVGKWTLAREMIRSQGLVELTQTIDGRDLVDATAAHDALAACPDTMQVLLVLHLDAASDAATATLGTWIDEVSAIRPLWPLATVTTQSGVLEQAHQARIERVRAVTLRLPSLDERADDIPLILRELVAKHGRGREIRFSSDAVRELSRPGWPGNVRQLEDVVRSTVASRVGEITVADLPAEIRSRSVRRSLSPIDQMECDAIIGALHDAAGNKVAAARLIGLSRSTIYRKIRAYGIDRDASFF
jgi:transcriptional regulator of acetoin/glycerol metabolism